MLDQLVESKSNAAENTRRSGFLLTTFVIMVSILIGGWLFSLFGKDYGMSDNLELSNLVAPVLPPEEAPPPPPEEQPKEQRAPDADVRKEIIQNIMETPQVPPKIETAKQAIPPRRLDVKTVQGDSNADAKVALPSDYRGAVNPADGKGIGGGVPGGTRVDDDDPPPPPTPKPTPKPVPKTISKGVINGSAISLPKPPYPAAARAVRASGAVNVQVTIDEDGRVISASAVSGHPLLRGVAEQAARGARFSPTQLSGVPVKVTGVIVYNFVP